jgi:spore coat polysaccharide biosynthesis protein SpsF (cytidylyltransferase family)
MKVHKDIAIFLAARSGSRRLPNKHFLKLCKDFTVIDLCIKRLKKVKLVNKIFLCTTKKKEDDKFRNVCKQHHIQLFRGSENDVQKRFIDCAKKNSINNIVRITADCPLIDSKIVDECVKIHLDNDLDYTSNILKLSYPDGLDVEIIKLNALIKSQNLKKDLFNKEHVTPFIRSSKLFRKYNLQNLKNCSNRRWTLDYKKDFIFLKKVINYFSPNINFSWKELIKAEKKFPFLINTNKIK